jgi:hypothetical protein
MLMLIELFNSLPSNYEFDESEVFEPGQIAALKIKGGKISVGVSDGINPIGIIDDIRSEKARTPVWDEKHTLTPTQYDLKDGKKCLRCDYVFDLNHPRGLIQKSFHSSVGCILDPKHGCVTILKGTPFNQEDGILVSVNYAYNTSMNGFEDSTTYSHRCTVWEKRMIVRTNMFDTTVSYPKFSSLYVVNGFLTTTRMSLEHKFVGIVLGPPTHENPMLEFLFDPSVRFERSDEKVLSVISCADENKVRNLVVPTFYESQVNRVLDENDKPTGEIIPSNEVIKNNLGAAIDCAFESFVEDFGTAIFVCVRQKVKDDHMIGMFCTPIDDKIEGANKINIDIPRMNFSEVLIKGK